MLVSIIFSSILGLLTFVTVIDGAGHHKEDSFKKVEGLLKKVKLPRECDKESCKMEFYMSKIQAKLKAEDKKHMFRSKNKELVALLNQLIFIEKAVTNQYCDRHTLKQVKDLEWTVKEKQLDKVKYMVEYYGSRYRRDCTIKKVARYEEKYDNIDIRVHQTLEPFLNRIIYARVCGYSPNTGVSGQCHPSSSTAATMMINNIDSFEKLDEPVFIDELWMMVSGSPDEGHLMQALKTRQGMHPSVKKKIEHLLEENLVEPCQKFVKNLEPVYEDAINDFDQLIINGDGDINSRFSIGLTQYRLCKDAIHHSDNLLSIVFSR